MHANRAIISMLKMDLAYTIRFMGSFNPKRRKRFVPDDIHKKAHQLRSAPRYAAIEGKITEAIEKELLPAGVVVTEDPHCPIVWH